MVRKFYSNVVSPPALLYMGRDKVENEELIRWGWPEDVWFHVDNLRRPTSTFGYHKDRRLKMYRRNSSRTAPSSSRPTVSRRHGRRDQTTGSVADRRSNGFQTILHGCKMNEVGVCYTMWENLRKTGEMDVGQIGFHSDKAVKRIKVEKKNEIVNRLNKTEIKDHIVDFQAEREARDSKLRAVEKAKKREFLSKQDEERKKMEQEKEARSYDRLFKDEKMTSNADGGNDSDDFM
ncbi:hypothetical protein L596_016543 [Steinernema carpocapsae]|uniref:Coiled-coil domain-containing protein 25 n=1 Tax=Steinernema carpocapsae TaxID=34508 RepID=A0A4U5NIA4_STECR|nr:hypothetical protein L596_016543 [Steinernema carpocapsae]